MIANAELKNARIKIHELIDPIWKSKKISRTKLYTEISSQIGKEYHTAHIKNISEARDVYRIALQLKEKYLK